MADTFTPEQLESLRRHLAEKVMWWELQSFDGDHEWMDNAKFKFREDDWNPPENIEQAMMCFGYL